MAKRGQNVYINAEAVPGKAIFYKPVIGWKLQLSHEKTIIWVRLKNKSWVELEKPRNSFEDTVRSILITLACLHYVYLNPDTDITGIWSYLKKAFAHYDSPPSQNDLQQHRQLIRDVSNKNQVLKKAKVMVDLVRDYSRKDMANEASQKRANARMPGFIVEDGEVGCEDATADDSEDKEDDDLFDPVCSLCDNGGDVLCCEGRCLRSFHATIDAGSDSSCRSLGFSAAFVKALPNFYCSNCVHKKHQCYACGELGSSDNLSTPEVYLCGSATCGHFYHPKCVAKLIHPANEALAATQERSILGGESFICPLHICLVCKDGEIKKDRDLQLAVCRRCPKAYHRKCLPKEIIFDDSDDEDGVARAWDDLIPNRILIYCLDHEIVPELNTPLRNNIIFLEDINPMVSHKQEKRLKTLKAASRNSKTDMLVKKNFSASAISSQKTPIKKASRFIHVKGDVGKDKVKMSSSKKPVKVPGDHFETNTKDGRLVIKSIKPLDKSKLTIKKDFVKTSYLVTPALELTYGGPDVDEETEKRIKALVEKSKKSLSLDDIKNKVELPLSYRSSSASARITQQGKIENSVEAVKQALKKIEENNIVHAKALCEPDLLIQLMKWKTKYRVYLAPFLHGSRYTSFGRHFTKVEKLQEIVDKLHCYIKNGDTIVDFCCGSNDFSLLLKEKLEMTGKKCSFRNFDLIRPKNDFDFEQRDWLQVDKEELPAGSQLVMGLNPPFGVNGALANKFVDHALLFRPKLIVLIVPPETERLDKKKYPYELVWEDDQKLSGSAFYLPGSVDNQDKEISQWNNTAPVLSLWSRPDWAPKHHNVALEQRHAGEHREEPLAIDNNRGLPPPAIVMPERENLVRPEIKKPAAEVHSVKEKSTECVESLKKRKVSAADVQYQDHKKAKIPAHDNKRNVKGATTNPAPDSKRNVKGTTTSPAPDSKRNVKGTTTSPAHDNKSNVKGTTTSPAHDNKSNVKGTSLASYGKQRKDTSRELVRASLSERSGSYNHLDERPSGTFRSPNRAGKEHHHPKEFGRSYLPTDDGSDFRGLNNILSDPDLAYFDNRYSANDDAFDRGTSNKRHEYSANDDAFDRGTSNKRHDYRRHETDAGLYSAAGRGLANDMTSENRYQAEANRFHVGVHLPAAGMEHDVGNFSTSTRTYMNEDFDRRYGDRSYPIHPVDTYLPQRSFSSIDQDRQRIGSLSTYPPPMPSFEGRSVSAMDRYAPQLDELNPRRQSQFVPQPAGSLYGGIGMGVSPHDYASLPSTHHYRHPGSARGGGLGGWIDE